MVTLRARLTITIRRGDELASDLCKVFDGVWIGRQVCDFALLVARVSC